MNLEPDLEGFREEVRDFIARELPADVRADVASGKPIDRTRQTAWQRSLWRRGWIAPGWPEAWGGCRWSAAQQHAFDEECVAADAPFVNPFGLFRAGPVLLAFGTPAQQKRFLPGILDSSTWWCQGYSEPGAGSDLAALSLRAECHGDHYRLNGTKTWTTQAHLADWMFCLVRTGRGSRPRDGISFLLVDMRSRGITVRPIPLLDLEPHVNEVHFEDVEVPIDQRLGDEGEGWACSAVVLGHERLQIAEVPQSRRLLTRLATLAASTPGTAGRPWAEDPLWRQRFAALHARWVAHAHLHRCFLERSGSQPPGPEVSMLKLRGSELRQQINELAVDTLGAAALRYESSLMDGAQVHAVAGAPQDVDKHSTLSQTDQLRDAVLREFLYSRASTIYGGSSEIQRNILARQLLRLT